MPMNETYTFDVCDCPVCGSEPQLRVKEVEGNEWNGYRNETLYYYECPDCGLIKVCRGTRNVATSRRDRIPMLAQKLAATAWNYECDRVHQCMEHNPHLEK